MIDYLKRSFDRLPITQERRNVFNLPNTITLLRIGIIPAFFFSFSRRGPAAASSLPHCSFWPP